MEYEKMNAKEARKITDAVLREKYGEFVQKAIDDILARVVEKAKQGENHITYCLEDSGYGFDGLEYIRASLHTVLYDRYGYGFEGKITKYTSKEAYAFEIYW